MHNRALKIAVVAAVYPPEPVISAQIAYDLAEALVRFGHSVTVICPRPTRPIEASYSQHLQWPGSTLEHEIKVVRISSITAAAGGMVGRALESWSFGRAAVDALAAENFDTVYANVWPLFSQRFIANHSTRAQIPLVLHVQDMYPESLLHKLPKIVAFVLGPSLLSIDARVANIARHVVVPSEAMRRAYIQSRRVPAHRIMVCRNWQSEEIIHGVESADRAANAAYYGINEKRFTFLYFGNIGPVACVENVVAAFVRAKMCQAQLVIAGSGSRKSACKELASKLGGEGVLFIEDPRRESTAGILGLADVFVLPMRRGAGSSSVPSKLVSYLFAGRPILASVDDESDTARCVREAKCGWVGAPQDEGWLAAQMGKVESMQPERLRELGANARAYGISQFSKSEGVAKLSRLVIDVGT